ncbi:MAG: hypothetical protein U9N49_05010 [Campylobacterota bacterium]|nr:hypothetical protein [Campylobacterota bacterium]
MSYGSLLDLEKVSQNRYSPCVIDNEEVVARLLFSPRHYLDGEILPMAFDQVTNEGGMSILRMSYFFENSLNKTISQIGNSTVKYCGYACAKVEDIRAIKIEDLRVCYVLDTATKEKRGHADIFYIKFSIEECGLPKKALKTYVRKEIAKVFNQLIIVKQ